MQLSTKLSDRSNNLTAVRLFLSWLVLYGHSYAIIRVPGQSDAVSRFFNHTWVGAIAVELFFALSGMLVAKSFADRGLVNYTISRILRIYPALIVCILLSVVAIGPILTTLPLAEYFGHSETHR